MQSYISRQCIFNSDEEWLPVFRGFSGTSAMAFGSSTDMFDAWVSGTHITRLLQCSTINGTRDRCETHYRRDLVTEWRWLEHKKVFISYISYYLHCYVLI